MDLEALTIDVRDLEEEGFMEPVAQAVDDGEVDVVVQRWPLKEPADLLTTPHGGEPICRLSAYERQCGPVTLQNVLIEEADAAVVDAHGRGGEAVDVFPVQEVSLEFLFRDAVG
jgi:hypothetical protein